MHVVAADQIIQLIRGKYPFLDLTGIDVGWTAQEIVDTAVVGFENAPVITLEEIKKHCKKE